jgi:SAM-dependent methyltransferase
LPLSYPFLIWTVQRTGGTSLTELLMKMSEHQSADHEPFNWRNKPRQFGHIVQEWVETKNNSGLAASLGELFDQRYLIKHCYELHDLRFAERLLKAAEQTNYRHILLLRRDELSRLVSKYIAEANGTWFKDYASKVYAGIAAQEREMSPLPVEDIVKHYIFCRKITDRVRALLNQKGVEKREIWYEDIYVGDRETRLANLNALFQFLDFTPETIAAHQADIEEKIFHSGQNTGNILQFVPNLDEVRLAMAEAGYRSPISEQPVGKTLPHPGEPPLPQATTESSGTPANFAMNAKSIFTPKNGFVLANGLGYSPKELRRHNARYRTFFLPNIEQIEGARVLDLGSYDGRWSFAALEHGAASVVGIERRQDSIDRSRFIIKEEMRDRVQFICDDIFTALPTLLAADERFDVILCLGVLYEIMDHRLLLQLMTDFSPRLIIIDTNLIDSDDPVIRVKMDEGRRKTSGVVSRGAMALMAESLDYKIRYGNWDPESVRDREGLNDYFSTNKAGVRRYTLYLEKA